MKNLKRLGAAIALTCVLGTAAFAGETMTPPCAPPEPGQTMTPPCAGQMASDNSATPAVVSTPSASDAGYLIAEAAISLSERWLSLF
jgi:hypothetical protein